jgi:SSS family solute:Na+ symporter
VAGAGGRGARRLELSGGEGTLRVNATEFVVFLVFFALVTVLGFVAARWQRGDLSTLHEWGLAGRRFGTFVSWFLIGGDLYTAYTFIAVPALVFGAGALGFFAVPYTVVIYPLLFAILPRLWAVSQRHGYITASDFVQGRWNSHWLALAIAVTGIVATMPYIALQLVGMQVVFQAMGLTGAGIMNDLPLIIAFAILALYTYSSGLRAPALVAVVKDLMIYITVIVAIIVIPARLGGFGHIFQMVSAAKPAAVLLSPKTFAAYGTLAFGSAMALFFYPHAITGILSARSQQVIRRNSVLLPLYSLLLGFIALLGFMAVAAGLKLSSPNLAVPTLLTKMFSPWFVGFGFAAIVVGALVPAAIMSIAAANMFTRNIFKPYFRPDASPATEANTAKLVSLFVKLGALIFVVAIPLTFSLYLQTLGGIWILQTVPSLIGGLYTRWFHRTALFWGWLVGMVLGTWMPATVGFKTSFFALHLGGSTILGYAGVWALIVNLVIVLVLSPIFHATGVSNGKDDTVAEDYVDADGGPRAAPV